MDAAAVIPGVSVRATNLETNVVATAFQRPGRLRDPTAAGILSWTPSSRLQNLVQPRIEVRAGDGIRLDVNLCQAM